MADHREAFGIFDLDGDGLISAQELKTMMERLGNPINDREVRDIITEAGSLSTNSITQAQFAKLMADGEKLGRQQDPETQVRDAFNLFDKDGDGKISKKEMAAALAGFGLPLNDRETDLLIQEATVAERDKTSISFDVFKKVMHAS